MFKKLLLTLSIAFFPTLILAGGGGGTPTITDGINLLKTIQQQTSGAKAPVVQLQEGQYIRLLSIMDGVDIGKYGVGLIPREILIKDGIPVLKLSYQDRSKPDVYVVTPDYYKSFKDPGTFYRSLETEGPNLPRLAP